MKHLPAWLFCGLVTSLAGVAPLAFADTANITITGKVIPGTCTVGANHTIALDDIRVNNLVHQTPVYKPYNLTFTGCSGVQRINMEFTGTVSPRDANLWANTASNRAVNVEIALRSGTTAGDYLARGTKTNLPVSAGTATYTMRAGLYWRSTWGAATTGNAQANVTVNVTYE